jgi:hypothetical protein
VLIGKSDHDDLIIAELRGGAGAGNMGELEELNKRQASIIQLLKKQLKEQKIRK